MTAGAVLVLALIAGPVMAKPGDDPPEPDVRAQPVPPPQSKGGDQRDSAPEPRPDPDTRDDADDADDAGDDRRADPPEPDVHAGPVPPPPRW